MHSRLKYARRHMYRVGRQISLTSAHQLHGVVPLTNASSAFIRQFESDDDFKFIEQVLLDAYHRGVDGDTESDEVHSFTLATQSCAY